LETKGVVFVVDGAGGSGFLPFVFSKILPEAGLEMNHFRWGAGYMRIIKDLTNRDINKKKASELASQIREYRAKFPNQNLHLVAKSAGTAIALWAMSELEPKTLDRVVLLSAAVSPAFPLHEALPAARQDVYSFWSPNDFFWLGLGTSLFGTADGVRGNSAGLVGFKAKRPDAKLREIKWDRSMISSFHVGTHSGTSMPRFIRRYVMPLLSPDISATGTNANYIEFRDPPD
jgi:pimeloyl-ACP methyl ester carboxylesterase